LIIDDDKVPFNVTKALLEYEGVEIFTQSEGYGIINLVSQLQPDLVLIDVNMPKLSGDTLAMRLQSNEDTNHTQIAFNSSNVEDSLRKIVKT